MTDDEDLRQTIYDYFNIEAQRHRNIMTAFSDVTTKIEALGAAFDAKTMEINTAEDARAKAFTDAVTSLKAEVDKALADLTAAGAAGQSAMFDRSIAALDGLLAKINAMDLTKINDMSIVDQLNALKAEVAKAIAAVPVPSVPSPA